MPKKKITYDTAIQEIEIILEQIESNDLNVDDLAESVKRVSELVRFCKKKLHETEIEVENILKDMDNE